MSGILPSDIDAATNQVSALNSPTTNDSAISETEALSQPASEAADNASTPVCHVAKNFSISPHGKPDCLNEQNFGEIIKESIVETVSA